jgi:asparagine synthase (glutamine-hydrolysing)
MCGIVGAVVFDKGSFEVSEEYLRTMRDVMVLRGPDAAGLWISEDGRVGLGHRRLSIIDLSDSASQPMSNDDGTIHLSFNGEIYNHAEIRIELDSLTDIDWKTDHSDTEVVLRAFEVWGIECLERFRGMFALAIWDGRSGDLWLVRDRLGIKPLYYSRHNDRLTFASEIKALLEDPQQARAVDEDALFHYLSFLITPAPSTLFEGIKKLEPATWLRVKLDGTSESKRYYEMWDEISPIETSDEAEVGRRVLSELREAVALRKVGDVPVGVFLSGGIDSSTNAALFSEGSAEPVQTFSIGYTQDYDSYTNELHFARMAADYVGADYHQKLLRVEDLLGFVPTMVHLQDEPIADPVCIPVYFVSKLARDNGVIVCQVGEGADELFWGYPTWKLKHRIQRWGNIPGSRWLQRLTLWALGALGKKHRVEYEALRRSANGQPIFWSGAEAFTEYQKSRLLSPRLRARYQHRTSWEVIEPHWKRFQEKAWEPSILHWMSHIDLAMRLPELLLMRVDKMSMGVSLEGRVPFLDHKFVELALSIPERMKIRRGNLKNVLKGAVRGTIPDELIDRKKQGFGVPVHEWLLGELGVEMRKELEHFCTETDLLEWSEVQGVLDSGNGSGAWYLYNLAVWWRQWIEEAPALPCNVAQESTPDGVGRRAG